jgi:hypothetical protein
LSAADARAGFEVIKSGLAEVKINGQSYWHTENTATSKSSVYLLPGFDEYLLGYQDRSVVLDPQHARQVWPGGGTFHPTVVADGQVVGTWKSAVKKGTIVISPALFGAVPDDDALDAAAQAYGEFMGMRATAGQ